MNTCNNLWTNLRNRYCYVSEAATLLGVSRQRVVVLCQRGQLPGARLAFGRWWIPRTAIVERKKVIASDNEKNRKTRRH
jgi:excisionase family DNA binding protein